MDLPSADPEAVMDQIVDLIGCDRRTSPASGKTGLGVDKILEAIVERVPPPRATGGAAAGHGLRQRLQLLPRHHRLLPGAQRQDQEGRPRAFFNTGREYNADEIGVLGLDLQPQDSVETGNVGYIISGIKNAKEVKVGDTLTLSAAPCEEAVKGFEDVKPMVFAGIYPVDTEDYEELRYSMEKLQLNDASLVFEPESSAALGFGFRCGFLGMLHMEIVQERLEREFNMTVITTVPNVSYICHPKKGSRWSSTTLRACRSRQARPRGGAFIKARSSPRRNTSGPS